MAPRNISSNARLDSLIENVREPFFVLAADRRILMVNRAWEDLTGYTAGEVLGLECRPHGPTRVNDLIGLVASFAPPLEAVAGQPAGGKTLIIRRGGERIQRRVEFWPFHDGEGRLSALVGLVRPAESEPQAANSERDALRFALLDLRARLFARHRLDSLIGQGPAHRRVLDGITAAAATTLPVTVVGEPGTGKRFVARLIHQQGANRQMPLMGFDCEAIPAEVLERELFAGSNRLVDPASWGRLAAPEGATVVLGDVLSLPRDFQEHLAASLSGPHRSVRLIATTAGDLDVARRDDQLRDDLFHALSVLVIRLQPLRDRLNDVPLLAQSLLERAVLRGQVNRTSFEPAALDVLMGYDWPGNLRELARVVDDAHSHAQGDLIGPDDIDTAIRGHRGGAFSAGAGTPSAAPPLPLRDQLDAFERQLIQSALAQARGNKTIAARRLGVNRPFLYRRLKELGIDDPDNPEADSAGVARSADLAS